MASRNKSVRLRLPSVVDPVPPASDHSASPKTSPSDAGISSANPIPAAPTATTTSRPIPSTRRVTKPPSSQPTVKSAKLAPISGSTSDAAATISATKAVSASRRARPVSSSPKGGIPAAIAKRLAIHGIDPYATSPDQLPPCRALYGNGAAT